MNCQISPDLENLNKLNSIYPWIPNSKQIRPPDELKTKKEINYKNAESFYQSTKDYLYDIIFNFPTEFNSEGKLITLNSDQLVKVFKLNEYPYQLSSGSNHYVLWYNCQNKPYSYDQINLDIQEELSKISNNFQYVWYENPSMSVPEIYHVQVFFIIL